MWIDNFNKNQSFRIPDLNKGVYQDCNWTGVALREYTVSNIDMQVRRVDGHVVPAMPSQKQLFERTAILEQWFHESVCKDDDDMFKHDTSWVVTWGVHNVPLKPRAADVPEAHKKAVESKNLSLETLHPMAILEENVGSNRGLAQVFRVFYDEQMALPLGERKYMVFNVDSNIFKRCMTVLTIYIHIHVVGISSFRVLLPHIFARL